ncbi:hypothetical protein GGE07_006559 [Sinorhizobium terangae]|uniref:Uncharacterized protein n=1 Tax=Sinorhizobium terangae TaxID=110322 RepID=A0A6N7LJ28_SINTE|nr:hypothetical protein [Sinorhizobium terangae]MBB4189853.1 hypothetical protein [Sinorhizobium terangae]MQX17802.1 hypothetical protein [Sinorhizobium terangae]
MADAVLERGRPLISGETPLEVYGQFAPAFGRFGGSRYSLIAGEFWNILHIARQREDGEFEPTRLLRIPDGTFLELDQRIQSFRTATLRSKTT